MFSVRSRTVNIHGTAVWKSRLTLNDDQPINRHSTHLFNLKVAEMVVLIKALLSSTYLEASPSNINSCSVSLRIFISSEGVPLLVIVNLSPLIPQLPSPKKSSIRTG